MDFSKLLSALSQGCVDPFQAILPAKDSPSQPAPPDYTGAARATSAGTVQSSIANNLMAHPNIYTPLGSQTWQQTGTQNIPGAEGNAPVDIPTYRQDINMTPQGQGLYDQGVGLSQGLMGLGQGSLGQVRSGLMNPINTGALPGMVSGVSGGQIQTGLNSSNFDRKHVEDALYGRAKSRLDPQWQQNEQRQAATLADQGIPLGSEAYTQASGNLSRAKNDAYANALNDAIAAGGAETSRAFGIEQGAGQFANQAQAQGFGQAQQGGAFQNQARAQALQEALALRQQPLSEFNAIRTGAQPNMPQFQPTQYAGGVTGPNMTGAAGAQGQWDLGQYNAGVGQANSFNSGLMGLAGTLGSGYFFGR